MFFLIFPLFFYFRQAPLQSFDLALGSFHVTELQVCLLCLFGDHLIPIPPLDQQPRRDPQIPFICRAVFSLLLSSSSASSLNSSVYVRYLIFFSSIILFLFFLVYWIWTFFVSTFSGEAHTL